MRRAFPRAGLATLLSRLRSDRRGSITVIAATSLLLLFGLGSLAVDIGSFHYAKRRQQTANDLAALAAASDLAAARRAAAATLVENRYTDANIESLETGSYTASPTVAPADRFVPGPAAGANAVRLRLTTQDTPLIFGRIAKALAGGEANGATVRLRTTAVAAIDSHAAFAIGTRLAGLDGGLANQLLGSLIGANLTLSLMDYEALASTQIDLFRFTDALATRLNLTAVSYDTVLRQEVRLPDALGALSDVAGAADQATSRAISALARIVTASAGSNRTVDLTKLLSLGVHGSNTTGGVPPLSASLSAFDLVSAIAQIANGRRQVEAGLDLGVPGIASVSLKLAIGERPQGTSMVRVGQVGATVSTAQTRLLITVAIAGTGQASLIKLPLYIEIASATARLAAISCAAGNVGSSSVTLAVRPGIVDAWIADVSAAQFENTGAKPTPGPATLVNLAGLATVTGRANVAITNINETNVAFSYADIQNRTRKTVSTTDFTSSLVARLVGNLSLKVNVLGLGLGLLPGLDQSVIQTLNGVTAPLDKALASLLRTLGIGLGQADVWVTGVRCGGAVLVN